LKEKAIIIGGGIAGLLAARVLSTYFKQVLIIEKDRYPEKAVPRNGVPQSHHIHILLMRGKQILDELFPNLEANLISRGANKVDLLADVKYYLATGVAMRPKSGLYTLACSRPLLEYAIRNEILDNYQNVQILDNAKVANLFYDEMDNKVIGVNTISNNSYHKFYGELIVDASGRMSETVKWLENIGLEKPKEKRVDSYIGYASREYEATNDFKFDWKSLIVLTKPPVNPRMAVVYPVENNSIMVGLLGLGRTYPPTEDEGFKKFARQIGVDELDEILKDSKPTSPIFGYRERGSRQYQFEKMEKWPENFVVLGDSVCAFNPFYGQGITVAALCAKALDKSLKNEKKHIKKGFARRFQKKIAKVNSFPWLLGTSEDLRWPTTKGTSFNFIVRSIQKYVNKVMLLGPESELATRSFFSMMHLLKPPIVLFHPKIIMQIFAKEVTKKISHT
jgi:flavin-dependent dehydrogenase